MDNLIRAPKYADWSWNCVAEPDLGEAKNMMRSAGQVAGVLMREGLMTPSFIFIRWATSKNEEKYGIFSTRLKVTDPSNLESISKELYNGRPESYANAPVASIQVSGYGSWITEKEETKEEWELVRANFYPFEDTVGIHLYVYHDIWSTHDFSGKPHPDIFRYNAPRLERAIRSIELSTGDETLEGDPTMFATPTRYGIQEPVTENGIAQDTTQWL